MTGWVLAYFQRKCVCCVSVHSHMLNSVAVLSTFCKKFIFPKKQDCADFAPKMSLIEESCEETTIPAPIVRASVLRYF